MKCSQCGAEFDGNFCPVCGAKAEVETPPPVQQNDVHQQSKVNTPLPKKPKKAKKPFYKKWWFIVIVAVVAISLVSSMFGGKGSGKDKIEWSKMELIDQIPEPPSNKGTIYDNSDEELYVSLDGVTDDQYNDYLDTCVDKGFTIDPEKSSGSYKAFNSEGYCLDMSHYSDSLTVKVEAPMEFSSITWPTSTVGKLLPAPKSTTGKFSFEHDDSFFVYVGETSREDYDQYVADCSGNGFNVDYNKGDTYYQADNEAGYHISVDYEGNNIMTIRIDAPDDSEGSSSQEATAPQTSETTEPKETEVPENNTDANSLRPDFKEAMDSYEQFIDEYVAFMKKYAENPDDLTLLADYASYMSDYADMVEKFDKWESEDLNDAELSYYIDVQARVSKKLLEAATN